MRRPVIATSFFVLALLMPRISGAQMYPAAAPLPQATAVAADWQRGGQPLFLAGTYYDPAGPTVYFDGDAMRPTGVFRGVLLYEDPTREPGSRVFVPVGQKLVRPYERRRNPLELTTGSWTPWLPLQGGVDPYDASAGFEAERAMGLGHVPRMAADVSNDAVGAVREPALHVRETTGVESIPAPRSSDGVWIVFEGERWYSNGKAERFSAERFSPAGNYRGFPVYRDNRAATERIFVTVVADGPVAPYARR